MADDAFSTSYVYKTNPNPYHELVVQSQKMINDALYNMWAVADSGSPLLSLSLEVKNVGSIDASLNEPTVRLNVTTSSPQLYFFVTFSSGTLKLYTADDPTTDPSTKTWDITGWKFAFPVTIGTNTLQSGNAEYTTYVKCMGLKAGDFTLAQLYIDMSQSTTWDSGLSSFGAEVWTTETSTVQTRFKDFVKDWLDDMKDNDKTVVGVSLKAGDPTSVDENAPSFPPTSCDHIMYPWMDPSKSSTPTDGLDGNALCLALMTNNESPPSPASLPYSGTFVNDTDDRGGAFCMRVQEFWVKWFLPLMQVLNKSTEIYPTKPYANAHGDGSCEVAPRFYIGYNPEHPDLTDPYFSFHFGDWYDWYDWVYWQWNGDSLKSQAEDDAGSWWHKVFVKEYANSGSWVLFNEGGQKISILGSSSFVFEVYQTGVLSGPFSTQADFTIWTSWHVNFTLGVVSDGGLQIVRIPDPDGTSACTVSGKSSTEGLNWNISWDDSIKQIENTIDTNLNQGIDVVANAIQDSLANQHKFFLPASGTFLMRDAEFNHRGDLMTTLFYNGAQPPGEKVKLPEYLKKKPARLGKQQPGKHFQKPEAPIQGPKMRLPKPAGPEAKLQPRGPVSVKGPPPMMFKEGKLMRYPGLK